MKRTRAQPDDLRPRRSGIGQLSLVEHALCPLDTGASLRPNAAFDYEYHYTDASRHQRTAKARVDCPAGLSAVDEFYLWGLLALTFSQPEPDGELHATPHYCLRRLGLIDQHVRRGGRQYRQFADAVERLSLVSYRNDAFYDPVRAEHRRVSFRFLSYSLPLDPDSSRAWQIAWDPIFFQFVRPTGGKMRFDLTTYRKLDPASRRLFLFASKLFARRTTTPRLDLRHLAVNVMGFQPTISVWDLKQKVKRCVVALTKLGVFPLDSEHDAFVKRAPGHYSIALHRGGYFERRSEHEAGGEHTDSAAGELLRAIGLDDRTAVRMLRQYPMRLVREWADITLAAKERFGECFFKKSPQAYFVDNVQNAARGIRTPPDWWHELRTVERQRHRSGLTPEELDEAPRVILERIRNAVFAPAPATHGEQVQPDSAAIRSACERPAPLRDVLLFPSLKKQ